MRRYILAFLSFLLLNVFGASATHIVGGELQLVSYNPRASQYQVILRMYCDYSSGQGATNSEPNTRSVSIFQKSTNQFITDVQVEQPKDRNGNWLAPIVVNYTNAACTDGTIVTRLLRYTGLVTLSPSVYSDPGGYYMAVTTCCRNAQVVNISNPTGTGYTFYLEFPALNNFRNSSPFFPELGTGTQYSQGLDYLCANEYRKFFFGATDADGDSLVYRMVTPMDGQGGFFSGAGAVSAPYDSVQWLPGYNRNNQIPGAPPILIDRQTGVLEIKPFSASIGQVFVIGIVCEEFRNGVKIGEVRRDFQFTVAFCPVNYAPELTVLNPSVVNSSNQIEVPLDQVVCVNLAVTDSNWNIFGSPEGIAFNYITNVPSAAFLASSQGGTLGPGNNQVRTSICIDPCNKIDIKKDTVYKLTVIASDQRCPYFKYDSLNFEVWIKVPPNSKPNTGVVPNQSVFNVQVGQTLNFVAWAADPDAGDGLSLSAEGIDFDLASKGMSFTNVSGYDSISSPFLFTPTCENLWEGTYQVRFIARDSSCIFDHLDTTIVTIVVGDEVTTLPEINPTNLVTPNGDRLNDYYEFINLPIDNCTYYFKGIEIYNMWGSRVFYSKRRDFRWDPIDLSDGMYFYRVDLNEKELRGWVQVVH